MLGLSSVGVLVVISFAAMIAIAAADWNFNRRSGEFGITTFVMASVFAIAVLVAARARDDRLDDYAKSMPFRNPLALTNDTQEALLFKVRAETVCVSKTFEAVLAPGEVTYFSSSTGGFCVLNALKADDSELGSRYEKLAREDEERSK